MKLLLDTHAFLFAIGDPDKLPPSARNALADPKTVRWVCAVSIWEIAVKVQIRKLDLPVAPAFYEEHIWYRLPDGRGAVTGSALCLAEVRALGFDVDGIERLAAGHEKAVAFGAAEG